VYDITKLVSKKQFEKLLELLPTPRSKRRGRRKCKKEALLNGVLQVLINGVRWNNIADCGCSDTSCYRYFKELQRRGKLKLVCETLSRSITDIKEGAIDTTTATSFKFKRLTGWDGKHKKWGTKISLFTGKKGLPADVVFGKGNIHDSQFLPTHLKKTAGRRRRVLNLDKGYCDLNLRREMRAKGTKINMPMRKGDYTRKKGPKFSFEALKYKVRFEVEKTFSWLKSFRRIRIRREYHPAMYKAFVYLGLIIVLIRS
jgi:transposase